MWRETKVRLQFTMAKGLPTTDIDDIRYGVLGDETFGATRESDEYISMEPGEQFSFIRSCPRAAGPVKIPVSAIEILLPAT